MNAILDTLAASRKLEESGMPEPQADAVVEVVSHAMKDLVTKEFLTAELDRRFGTVDKEFTKFKSGMDKRFTKLESKMDTGFAKIREDAAKSQKSMVFFMMASTLTIFATQLTMLAIMLGPLSGDGAAADAGVPPEESGAPPAVEMREDA